MHVALLLVIIASVPMEKERINTNGYTLIELLVVVVMISLLSTLSFAWYGNFREDKNFDRQIQILAQTIETAKTKAYTGDTSLCKGSIGVTPEIKGLTVDVDQTNIAMNPICTGAPTGYMYPVQANMSLLITPPVQIAFDSLGRSDNKKNMPICIPIKDTLLNKCRYVQVNESGLVTNGNCACPPSACSCQ